MHRLEHYMAWPYTKIENTLKRLSTFQGSILVVILSCLFASLYFTKTLMAPNQYIFADMRDDLKNYYTLKTYIDQPINKDIVHYNSMNYPYRDIVYYSDNTPLLSMPLKWLSSFIPIDPIPIFNYIIILNFIFSSVLCYFLLRKLIASYSLVVVLSLSLPYFNPQAHRLIEGTGNLSLSCILLANLYLVFKIYERNEKREGIGLYSLLNFILIFLSAFVHLYYLIILCLNTTLILVTYFAYKYKNAKHNKQLFLSATLVPVLAFIAVYLVIIFTDEFYSMRNEVAMGYGGDGWKTSIVGFFTPYEYLQIRFIIEASRYIDYEAYTYLGSFLLYGVIIFVAVFGVQKNIRSTLSGYFKDPAGPFILITLIASVISLFISFGPDYSIWDGQYKIRNFFDLFNLVHLFTKKVEHFRCLGRFSWIFFWSANLCFAFILSKWANSKRSLAMAAVYVLSFFAIKDLLATGETYRYHQFTDPFDPNNISPEMKRLSEVIHKGNYDAILPLPCFLVGSEIHDRTFDPPTPQYGKNYMTLSGLTRLPLMSSMLSRTPLPNNESLFDLLLDMQMDPSLYGRIKGKKIVVILDNDAYLRNSGYPVIDSKPLEDAFYNSQKLPRVMNMTPLDTIDKLIVYKWVP